MDTAGYAVEAGPSKKMSCLPVTELVGVGVYRSRERMSHANRASGASSGLCVASWHVHACGHKRGAVWGNRSVTSRYMHTKDAVS
jgi:hypothetical protein